MRIVCFLALIIAGCTPYQGHPFHIKNVSNYARAIEPTDDFITIKEWMGVLNRQPVISGKGKPTYAVLQEINNNCNKKVYKRATEWPTPDEFAVAPTGDCKGYAICKYYALRKGGFSANQVNIWSGDYLVDGIIRHKVSHLILAVRLGDKQYILDAGVQSKLPEAKDYFYKQFLPAYRFNENGWDVN